MIAAAWRSWRRSPSPSGATTLETVAVIVLLVTGAGGLGLLLSGDGPHEPLHILYGVLAVAALPVGASVARGVGGTRSAVITLVAAIVLVVLVARLFQTG